jgi:nucleotide-binding universal stress UspA family protein
VTGVVTYGTPGEELVSLAKGVDLLIVGSRGYGPVRRLIHGSVSRYLVRHAPCPLLVLPRTQSTTEGIDREAGEADAMTVSA